MSDSMTELSGGARAILDAGRDGDGAGDLERARVRRALLAKIAIAGGATLAASSTAAASGTAGSAASGAVAGSVAATGSAAIGPSAVATFPLAKILVPLAIVFGVSGTVAWRAQQHATTVPAPIVAPASAQPAPVAPAVSPVIMPIEPATPAVAPRRAPAHHAHVVARAEAPTNRLAEETALLAASNAQLRDGDATRALKLLDDYDRRYPAGVLREEVLATRAIARCQLGLTPDAASRRAADTFLRRHPASPLASRVRSSCGH